MNDYLIKAQYGPVLIDLLWNSDQRTYIFVNGIPDVGIWLDRTEFTSEDFSSGVIKKQAQLSAKIIAIDEENRTGMYHDPQKSKRPEMIGCLVTVRPAHLWKDKKVYYCYELREYFSEGEIELLVPVGPEEEMYVEE